MTRFRIMPYTSWPDSYCSFKIQRKVWYGWRTMGIEMKLETAELIVERLREFEIYEEQTAKAKENE